MDSIETLTTFFGWCTVLNIGFLAVGSIKIMAMRDSMARIHSRMFKVSEDDLPRIYFQWLAGYKSATFMLNLAPYVALKLMA